MKILNKAFLLGCLVGSLLTTSWNFSSTSLLSFVVTRMDEDSQHDRAVETSKINVQGASASFNLDSLASVPDWLVKYIEFHRNSIESDGNGGYKVKDGVPTLRQKRKSGGLGDRMNTIIGLTYLAVCTERVILLDPPYNLEAYLVPSLLQWNAQRGADRDRKAFQTPIGNQHTKNSSLIPPNLLDWDMWAPNLWRQWQVIKEKQCHQKLNISSALDTAEDSLEEGDVLYYFLFQSLFEFSPAARNRRDTIREHVGMDGNDNPYIAVHIRTGDALFNFSNRRHAENDTVDQFYQCSQKLQAGIQQCLSGSESRSSYLPKIYIASDNPKTKDEFHQNDPSTVRVMNDMEIFHVDRSSKGDYQDPKAAELDVWAELEMLVESTCVVNSRSGFSELAARVGSLPRCAVRGDECSDENIQKALANIGC